MPPKKKKSKKSKKGKKKEEYLPPIYNIPAYENPDIVTPKVDLIIKLVHPVTDLFTLRIKVIINNKIYRYLLLQELNKFIKKYQKCIKVQYQEYLFVEIDLVQKKYYFI